MATRTFTGKFLSKLDKIDRKDIENFLVQTVEEKSLLEIIINNMQEGLIVTDANFKVLFSNISARNFIGVSTNKEIENISLLDIIEDENFKTFLNELDKNIRFSTSTEVITEKPIERIININIIPVPDEKNQLFSIIFIIYDITERKRFENQRLQAEKVSSLATLTAGIAHEIKNPLNSLNIHVQLIKRSIDELKGSKKSIDLDRFLKSVDVIDEEIQRLGNVVDSFLKAMRPSKPQLEIKNINMIIQDVINIISPEAAEKKILLSTDLDQDLPLTYVDPSQLKQALINIVRNSIEAMHGRKNKFLKLITYFDKKTIHIDIIDSGCGIPEEDYLKIFEPYYTTKHSGTGLGLMTVYRIIKEHNGAIDLKSKIGEGTKFSIILPLPQTSPRLLDSVGIKKD